MSERTDQLRGAGRRVQRVVIQVVAAALVLVIFVGMGVLVSQGQLDGSALVFFSGIIVGYLAHAAAKTF